MLQSLWQYLKGQSVVYWGGGIQVYLPLCVLEPVGQQEESLMFILNENNLLTHSVIFLLGNNVGLPCRKGRVSLL